MAYVAHEEWCEINEYDEGAICTCDQCPMDDE